MNNNSNTSLTPAYLKLHKSGELKKRGEKLWDTMSKCRLCPRNCEKNRIRGELGICKASFELLVSSSKISNQKSKINNECRLTTVDLKALIIKPPYTANVGATL